MTYSQKFSILWYRGSPSEVFLGKGVLKIFSKFTGEHPCWSVISIKLQSNFIEITVQHGCSPVNLLPIFRTPFLKNAFGELLLMKWVMKNYALLCLNQNSNVQRISNVQCAMCRSSHQRCSLKKCVLRNFTKFTGKHLCQSLFF